MKKYELVLLLSENLKSEEQDKITDKIKKDIKDGEGKVIEEKDMGKRELMSLVKKQSKAIFKYFVLEIPTENMSGFRRKLQLNDNLLRYLLVVKE